jgi:hypothetical protein
MAIRCRSESVAGSGTQTSGRKSAAASWASTLASTLSVFTLAEAIARVFSGLETVTLPACALSSSMTGQVKPLDSITTWSSGRSDAAKLRSSAGAVEIRPSGRTACPSWIATSAKRLWRSRAIVRIAPPCSVVARAGWAARHLRIRARSATGRVEGAATYYRGLVARG